MDELTQVTMLQDIATIKERTECLQNLKKEVRGNSRAISKLWGGIIVLAFAFPFISAWLSKFIKS